ncbi:MAG: polyphosphate kinase 1 [Gammaproteobacteria bacterium]|jgi:polyphosphate kinase|nr:polyphosphate kinase 1 [Gammaproteobacteria bacterium]MBT3844995.1 polyphosphate kinase 1 [Gammaproteobacteria bacterium]MBT6653784.1 polyphosphate kinase 1 [Gammaproteobacteria bacterium]
MELKESTLYLNRELTWLAFNQRVLHEAEDPRNPLLERVKFIAIVSNNLDEFYMKRIGGLKQQVAAGYKEPTVDGRTPQQQIRESNKVVREIQARQSEIWRALKKELKREDIDLVCYKDLTESEQGSMRKAFQERVLPLLTPLAMDPSHPFPFISNLNLNLLVTLRYPQEETPVLARIKVPLHKEFAPRYYPVECEGSGYRYILIEELITYNLDLLFPGMEVISHEMFRITRNASVEKSEGGADDLLSMIESEVKERHFAPIVRLEVSRGCDPLHYGMLAAELGLDQEEDVFEQDNLAMHDLFQIASIDLPALHDAELHPLDHPLLAENSQNIFHIIRNNGPLLLHHPYQSFANSVERFVREASTDPKVLGIKMTLYRTAPDGKLIRHLIRAVQNGKQVAVLVEIKARFDEAANIHWARELEQQGIHVIYGVIGLKTHCKTILVVRQDYNGLARYCHIGTGNYHSGTARLYTDFGLLTRDEDIGNDLTELFNLLTGYGPKEREYRKILTSPKMMKKKLIEKIGHEVENHKQHQNGLIQFKMNALEDADVVFALYQAAQAGVKIDLIIRDTCRLRPGIEGLSESVNVISIVGRFLEHGRIYYFYNGGEEEYFIGSADSMKRNLESRVEVLAPVEEGALRQELRMTLDAQLGDQRGAWEMQPDGSYIQRNPQGSNRSAQQLLAEAAEKSMNAALKHRESQMRSKLLNRFKKRLRQGEKG